MAKMHVNTIRSIYNRPMGISMGEFYASVEIAGCREAVAHMSLGGVSGVSVSRVAGIFPKKIHRIFPPKKNNKQRNPWDDCIFTYIY